MPLSSLWPLLIYCRSPSDTCVSIDDFFLLCSGCSMLPMRRSLSYCLSLAGSTAERELDDCYF